MRRMFLGLLTALLVLAGLGQPAQANPQQIQHGRIVMDRTHPDPRAHLDHAHRYKDLTVQLLRLRRHQPTTLGRTQQVAARSMLDRPRLPRKVCSPKLCVHYATTGTDRATRTWALTTLSVMKKTWRKEVHDFGYPRPLKDGLKGGDSRFDVYLKEIGDQGYYGYCAPEGRQKRRMKSFCVLDNNFSRAEFGTRPIRALKVTAAHEFFHSIQFAMNAGTDYWMMESTAVWMEDQVFDGVNDYLQYVPYGQLGDRYVPLDTFDPNGATHYGNFAFWTWLSEHYGRAIVRYAWTQAEDTWSVQALRQTLASRGGFAQVFGEYATSLDRPREFYTEGATYGPGELSANDSVPIGQSWVQKQPVTLTHLTSTAVQLRPPTGTTWQHITLTVTGPAAASSPTGTLLVRYADGHDQVEPLAFTTATATTTVATMSQDFTTAVKNVVVTLANASQNYKCLQGTNYACQGTSTDDTAQFKDLTFTPS